MDYILTSSYKPTGDHPEAIRQLTDGINRGDKAQVLLGVTGSGKTFTIANVIANVGRPVLILSHNKTLAAQLYEEMRAYIRLSYLFGSGFCQPGASSFQVQSTCHDGRPEAEKVYPGSPSSLSFEQPHIIVRAVANIIIMVLICFILCIVYFRYEYRVLP